MLNTAPAPSKSPLPFVAELPQPVAPQQALAVVAPRAVAPSAPPGVYLPAIKDFAVTVLPVPVAAAIGGAICACAGLRVWDILPAMMMCATVLGVPGSVLMSRCLRSRQKDVAAWTQAQAAALPPAAPAKAA